MTDLSPNLRRPYLVAAPVQKQVTHNEAIRTLDALAQLAVLDRHFATPPVTPANGDRYIVAANPTGLWTGADSSIAGYEDGA